MTKAQLIDLVNALRAENSTLRTQLEAVRHVQPAANARREALQRLHALYPSAKSFSAAELAAELGARSCSA